MAPVRFDEIPRIASTVLNDEFITSGHQFRAKQKTKCNHAVFITLVDILPGKKGGLVTPVRFTCAFTKFSVLNTVRIDRIEMDKLGKLHLATSSNKIAPGALFDCKTSDLMDPAKITASCHYTRLKDMQLRFETKLMKPQDFTFEITRSHRLAQFGLKCNQANLTAPDVGLRLAKDALFCSVLAREKFSVFTAHGSYKFHDGLRIAAAYEHGGKRSGFFSVGFACLIKGVVFRAKVQQDQSVCCGVKVAVSRGIMVLCGGKYDRKGKGLTYGFQLCIE
eukprot:TRINITY_DN34847_c0_g1_i1.p1 TRINITY_DN34847_c0_g1~~TRINITY_DN34847_c0_g1_i1.p1  ORF type:complete len:278 (-),score=43.46 TRINITY_DN34847_c0_g1_i1:159-992(-)